MKTIIVTTYNIFNNGVQGERSIPTMTVQELCEHLMKTYPADMPIVGAWDQQLVGIASDQMSIMQYSEPTLVVDSSR